MSNSDIEQAGTVKGHIPNGASLSGRISNVVSLSGHISIGSGAGDFIIKMTLAIDDDGNYTLASCDATIEQIDAAVAAEKRVVVIASDGGTLFELPMLQGIEGYTYYFGMFLQGQVILSFVQKVAENESEWRFGMGQILSGDVGYSNDALPNISSVEDALNKLIPNSHTHANKSVLDKFAETDGKPTYDGEDLGGASEFIIKMTIEVNGDNYTVTSCDKTMEQIDAAVASGQNIKAIAFDKYVMPMTQMEYSESYTFGAFLGSFLIAANVYKNPESGTDDWQFYLSPITADIVEYYNAAMPRISTVSEALDELVPNSHTHTNKSVLDKFSESDGKPTYNGEALGGGAGDFIIKMTVEANGDYYTVTSCDATIEQIDAAVAAEKRVVLIATDTTSGAFLELPIVQAYQGATYMFIAFTYSGYMMATVYKSGGNDTWEFANGGITAEAIHYFNSTQPDVESVHAALNKLFTNSHTHANKDTLDKLSVSNGKLQYNGSDVSLKPAYYIDLAGTYPNYTCPVAMDDIKAAYDSGYNLVCRCKMGVYTATLPLFVPMPSANTWIFSGSGALQSMGFPAQSFTVAITANGVMAEDVRLARADGTLPNPYELQITVGNTAYLYDGSEMVNIVIDDGTEVSY